MVGTYASERGNGDCVSGTVVENEGCARRAGFCTCSLTRWLLWQYSCPPNSACKFCSVGVRLWRYFDGRARLSEESFVPF